jgi:hypothetical protein
MISLASARHHNAIDFLKSAGLPAQIIHLVGGRGQAMVETALVSLHTVERAGGLEPPAHSTATKAGRSERIITKAGEEHIFIPLRCTPNPGEGESLGERILQTARQPAEGPLINIVPETGRDLPYQFGVAGAGAGASAGAEEFGLATRVYEIRIAPAERSVRTGEREPGLCILELFAGVGIKVELGKCMPDRARHDYRDAAHGHGAWTKHAAWTGGDRGLIFATCATVIFVPTLFSIVHGRKRFERGVAEVISSASPA